MRSSCTFFGFPCPRSTCGDMDRSPSIESAGARSLTDRWPVSPSFYRPRFAPFMSSQGPLLGLTKALWAWLSPFPSHSRHVSSYDLWIPLDVNILHADKKCPWLFLFNHLLWFHHTPIFGVPLIFSGWYTTADLSHPLRPLFLFSPYANKSSFCFDLPFIAKVCPLTGESGCHRWQQLALP